MKMDLFRSPALRSVWFVLILSLVALPAFATEKETASQGPHPDPTESTVYEPATMTGNFKSAIVIDAETGLVIVDTNSDARRQPASMLKMLTELIVLEHILDGDMKLDEKVTVSARSSNMGGSQVYLKHGEVFTVEELLHALAIHSANDAAVALAEHLAGSVEAFVDLMNMRAQELGMKNSEFHSVHGLPAGYKQSPDITTAADLAILGRELIRHPQALEWASTKTAPFRDGKFTLYNPNKLVGKFRGLDGIKTGFTGPAGFCVTASAVQKGKRLISVVMGCTTDQARATETTRLLSFGFNAYKQVAIIPTAGAVLPEPVGVKGGKTSEAAIEYGESLSVMVPRNFEGRLVVENVLPEKVEAPLPAGQEVGQAVVMLDGVELGRVPLLLVEELPKGNWWNRLMNKK
jgi:serine-type D-Ala-D-Ala carboxypeptidase (penicillin-binding protein 5/6)